VSAFDELSVPKNILVLNPEVATSAIASSSSGKNISCANQSVRRCLIGVSREPEKAGVYSGNAIRF
jgi:hypothetical protein